MSHEWTTTKFAPGVFASPQKYLGADETKEQIMNLTVLTTAMVSSRLPGGGFPV